MQTELWNNNKILWHTFSKFNYNQNLLLWWCSQDVFSEDVIFICNFKDVKFILIPKNPNFLTVSDKTILGPL